jgi:peroxiredoxin (alkyl hydroperoxide reductase subunit C)
MLGLIYVPQEILAFNDALPSLKEINTVVLGARRRPRLGTNTQVILSEFPLGVSTDSQYSHLAWSTQPRKQGGLGPDLKLPLVADKTMQISRDYGVLLEDQGISLRGLFIIDPKGILRCVHTSFSRFFHVLTF